MGGFSDEITASAVLKARWFTLKSKIKINSVKTLTKFNFYDNITYTSGK